MIFVTLETAKLLKQAGVHTMPKIGQIWCLEESGTPFIVNEVFIRTYSPIGIPKLDFNYIWLPTVEELLEWIYDNTENDKNLKYLRGMAMKRIGSNRWLFECDMLFEYHTSNINETVSEFIARIILSKLNP